MEDSINNITDNIFKHVSLSEQENIRQWEDDKSKFKEQLFNEIKAIKDPKVRNAVIEGLIQSTKDDRGKNFVNANGSVNIGKIKDSTKSIQVQAERKIIEDRKKVAKENETVKEGMLSTKEKELHIKQVETEFKDILPKDWTKEEQREFCEKIADFNLKIPQYLSLLKTGMSKEHALKTLGISEENKGMFLVNVTNYELKIRKKELDSKVRNGTATQEDKKELKDINSEIHEAKEEMISLQDKIIKQKNGNIAPDSNSISEAQSTDELFEGMTDSAKGQEQASLYNDEIINAKQTFDEVNSENIKSSTKEILMSILDEGIDNMDDLTAIVESSLEGIEDEELRGKVSQAIEQLTQSQSLGDSGKSFEELLEAGELDESIIDSALEAQSQEIEQEETTIADNVTSIAYIEKGESFTVDEKWEKLCQAAQERGESLNGSNLERLLSQYMEGQGLEQIEAPKNPPSTLGEKAGEENELTGSKPPVVENPEVIQNIAQQNPKTVHNLQENGEDRGEDEDKNSVERREYADKDGKNKRTVLITNDSNGEIANVQVFKSLIANVKMSEFEEQVKTVRELANAKENIQGRQEGTKEDKEDVLE